MMNATNVSHLVRTGFAYTAVALILLTASTFAQQFTEVRGFGWGPGLDFPAPACADIDGNGKMDMLVGTYTGYIMRLEQVTEGNDAFQLLERRFIRVPRPSYAAVPVIVDLDGNGRLDLIVRSLRYGESILLHYEQPQLNSTTFELVADSLGGVRGDHFWYPMISDYDQDGLLDLLLFHEIPVLSRYSQREHNSSDFVQVDDLRLEDSTIYFPGQGSMLDIDRDGRIEFLIPTYDRGLLTYRAHETVKDSFFLLRQQLDVIPDVRASGLCILDLDQDGLLDLFLPKGDKLRHFEQESLGDLGFSVLRQDDVLGLFDFNREAGFAIKDLDNDGRLDILRFSFHDWTLGYPLCHYRQKEPGSVEVEFVTTRFNGITAPGMANPVLTDLDGDGLMDLLVVVSGTKNIQHYRQQSTKLLQFDRATSPIFLDHPFVQQNSISAAFSDLDGDGLLDMFFAGSNGQVDHYVQVSAGSTDFQQVRRNVFPVSMPRGYPCFSDIDEDGLIECLIGTSHGTVRMYRQNGKFSRDFSEVTDSLAGIAVLSGSAPAVVDFNRDGKPDLVVADAAGGFSLYLNTTPVGVMREPVVANHPEILDIVPHPVMDRATVRVTMPGEGHATLRMFDLLGREVMTLADGRRLPKGVSTVEIDSGALLSGNYLLVLETAETRMSKPIMIMK